MLVRMSDREDQRKREQALRKLQRTNLTSSNDTAEDTAIVIFPLINHTQPEESTAEDRERIQRLFGEWKEEEDASLNSGRKQQTSSSASSSSNHHKPNSHAAVNGSVEKSAHNGQANREHRHHEARSDSSKHNNHHWHSSNSNGTANSRHSHQTAGHSSSGNSKGKDDGVVRVSSSSRLKEGSVDSCGEGDLEKIIFEMRTMANMSVISPIASPQRSLSPRPPPTAQLMDSHTGMTQLLRDMEVSDTDESSSSASSSSSSSSGSDSEDDGDERKASRSGSSCSSSSSASSKSSRSQFEEASAAAMKDFAENMALQDPPKPIHLPISRTVPPPTNQDPVVASLNNGHQTDEEPESDGYCWNIASHIAKEKKNATSPSVTPPPDALSTLPSQVGIAKEETTSPPKSGRCSDQLDVFSRSTTSPPKTSPLPKRNAIHFTKPHSESRLTVKFLLEFISRIPKLVSADQPETSAKSQKRKVSAESTESLANHKSPLHAEPPKKLRMKLKTSTELKPTPAAAFSTDKEESSIVVDLKQKDVKSNKGEKEIQSKLTKPNKLHVSVKEPMAEDLTAKKTAKTQEVSKISSSSSNTAVTKSDKSKSKTAERKTSHSSSSSKRDKVSSSSAKRNMSPPPDKKSSREKEREKAGESNGTKERKKPEDKPKSSQPVKLEEMLKKERSVLDKILHKDPSVSRLKLPIPVVTPTMGDDKNLEELWDRTLSQVTPLDDLNDFDHQRQLAKAYKVEAETLEQNEPKRCAIYLQSVVHFGLMGQSLGPTNAVRIYESTFNVLSAGRMPSASQPSSFLVSVTRYLQCRTWAIFYSQIYAISEERALKCGKVCEQHKKKTKDTPPPPQTKPNATKPINNGASPSNEATSASPYSVGSTGSGSHGSGEKIVPTFSQAALEPTNPPNSHIGPLEEYHHHSFALVQAMWHWNRGKGILAAEKKPGIRRFDAWLMRKAPLSFDGTIHQLAHHLHTALCTLRAIPEGGQHSASAL